MFGRVEVGGLEGMVTEGPSALLMCVCVCVCDREKKENFIIAPFFPKQKKVFFSSPSHLHVPLLRGFHLWSVVTHHGSEEVEGDWSEKKFSEKKISPPPPPFSPCSLSIALFLSLEEKNLSISV